MSIFLIKIYNGLKTKDLITILEARTLVERFENVIKNHRRASLAKLYFFLKQTKSEDKAQLFAQINDQTYTPKLDYLLRNELRLLNEAIEAFLQEESLLQKFNEQPLLQKIEMLRVWLQAKQWKYFEIDYKKALQLALEQRQFQALVELQSLRSEFVRLSAPINHEAWTEIQTELQDSLSFAHAHYLETRAELRRRWAAALRISAGFKGKVDELQAHFPLPTLETQDQILVDALNNLAISYLYNGEKKIEILESTYPQFQNFLHLRPNFPSLEVSLLNNLALEHLFQGNFNRAKTLFQTLLQKPNLQQDAFNQIGVLFNYLTCLMRLREFETLLSEMQAHSSLVQSEHRLYHRFIAIEALAHLFLRQETQAFDCLCREDRYPLPETDRYYSRILYLICYYLRQDWDLCEREIVNVLQCTRYRNPINPQYVLTAKAFRRFITLKLQLENSKNHKKMQALYEEILQMQSSNFDFDNLQTLWLSEEIARTLSTH